MSLLLLLLLALPSCLPFSAVRALQLGLSVVPRVAGTIYRASTA
jgi:hypothetical protein